MMKKILLAIIAVSILAASAASADESKKEEPQPNDRPSQVKKAPAFSLKDHNGKTVKLEDYKGKIVVLEWFNYECPFVRYHYEKKPTMVSLANKYKDKNVVWLAVNSTSHLKTSKNKEFAKKNKVSYPILNDRSGKTGRTYGAQTTPHIFIVDKKGDIAYNGAIDDSPLGKKKDDVINYVDKALAELTKGREVTTKSTEPYGCSVKYAK